MSEEKKKPSPAENRLNKDEMRAREVVIAALTKYRNIWYAWHAITGQVMDGDAFAGHIANLSRMRSASDDPCVDR